MALYPRKMFAYIRTAFACTCHICRSIPAKIYSEQDVTEKETKLRTRLCTLLYYISQWFCANDSIALHWRLLDVWDKSHSRLTQIIGSQVLARLRGHRTPTRWSRRPCIQARTWPAPIRTLTAAVSWAEPRSGSRFSNGVTRTLSRNGIVSFSLPVLWSQFEELDVAQIRTRCAACQWWQTDFLPQDHPFCTNYRHRSGSVKDGMQIM